MRLSWDCPINVQKVNLLSLHFTITEFTRLVSALQVQMAGQYVEESKNWLFLKERRIVYEDGCFDNILRKCKWTKSIFCRTIMRFVSIIVKFGICTVVGLNEILCIKVFQMCILTNLAFLRPNWLQCGTALWSADRTGTERKGINRVDLKEHGNEADFLGFIHFLGFFHKSLPHESLTLPFEPFRFWLRIRGDIHNRIRS